MQEDEKFMEMHGRRFKVIRYLPEVHYEIEEKMGAALGGALARLFTAVEGRGALDAAASGDMSGVNAAQLGEAVVEVFTGLKRAGGFYAFAQRVLCDTSEVNADGAAHKVSIASWRGQMALIEDLVIAVLRFNFEAYFLLRKAQIARHFASSAPKPSANLDQV